MLSASLLMAALAAFSAGILSGVTSFGLAVIVVALLLLPGSGALFVGFGRDR